jgi:Putative homoserine kinase type II (protein kinase fold)
MELEKCIGIGNTAWIYEWGEGKVLKLFHQGYPDEAVETEYHNAMAIKAMGFAKPGAYNIISCQNRKGILYDRIDGETLLDIVMRTGELQECAVCMAKLHKEILNHEISNVPNYKDFLKYHLSNVLLTPVEFQEILHRIDQLPDGNTLCHGDFHPGNILISGGRSYVIDFMNICHGDYLYDIARTVYLVEYTPIPADTKDRDKLLYFKKTLTDLYLAQMNVSREIIQDLLTIISIVRKGECPDE